MTVPKVLVGVVTYEGKDYCWNKFYKALKNLDYPNFEVLIVDNTRSKRYYKELVKRTKKDDFITVERAERGENSRVAHANSLNVIRQRVLEGGYDYFMSIESDLTPPSDIIQRLLSHRKPVVGCIYMIGYPWSKKYPPQACLFQKESDGNGGYRTKRLDHDDGWLYFGAGLQPVHGCGLGTTLIRASVLKDVKFWYYIGNGEPKHSDVLFYRDLDELKIPVYVDTDIVIPHYNSSWDLVKDI